MNSTVTRARDNQVEVFVKLFACPDYYWHVFYRPLEYPFNKPSPLLEEYWTRL